MTKCKFKVSNLDCANCAREVEEHLNKDDNLRNVKVNFSNLSLSLETDIEDNVKEYVRAKAQEVEPDINILEKEEEVEEESVLKDVIRLIIGLLFLLLSILTEDTLSTLFCILSYIALLSEIAPKAIKMLIKSKTIDEHLLITISCIGAFFINERIEGLMVVILYQIGEILEDIAVNKSRKSIADLMNIKPTFANLKKGNEILEVKPEEVKKGSTIIVKKGERIPLDGIITSGESNLDTSALTGETKTSYVTIGDEILSGSINLTNILEIKVTKDYKNSTVSRILDLVENATDKKTKTENFVARAAKIYTPIIILLAIIVAITFPILFDMELTDSIYRALCFLVISCPCAIAISVPLSYFTGIGTCSKNGILVKGSDYLSNLTNITTFIFDKTGTITTGKLGFELVNITNTYKDEELKEYYCLGESYSTHPIAKSILDFFKMKVDLDKVKNIKEIPGKGITYEIDNDKVTIGSYSLVGSKTDKSNAIFLKINDEIVAKLNVSDTIKDGSKETIAYLKQHGMKTLMYTGDSKIDAMKVAEEIDIDKTEYELLPEEKYQYLEQKIKGNNGLTAFVGDGINDAPSLARSDIGISMGGVGSASSVEASDIVIVNDDISKIIDAINISKKTDKIIKENLVFAIGIKILVLTLSAIGIASMWQAVFADTGVTLITIINTTRILRYKK